MWFRSLECPNEEGATGVPQGQEEIPSLCKTGSAAHSYCGGCLLPRGPLLAAPTQNEDPASSTQFRNQDSGGINEHSTARLQDCSNEAAVWKPLVTSKADATAPRRGGLLF